MDWQLQIQQYEQLIRTVSKLVHVHRVLIGLIHIGWLLPPDRPQASKDVLSSNIGRLC